MKVIVIGDTSSIKEFKLKFSKLNHNIESSYDELKAKKTNSNKNPINEIIYLMDYENFDKYLLKEKAIIFDFFMEESIKNFEIYKNYSNIIIFGNIVKSSLSEIYFYYGKYRPTLFGFNGIPGMLNRKHLEVTSVGEQNLKVLKESCELLNTDYLVVEDRVGMVTPRIISMIINEAYFTVQEGTATKEDIDIAMKLGTNYPYGPFEWCSKIGIKNVYELLEAIYEDTKDERYKICPLLKKEYRKITYLAG